MQTSRRRRSSRSCSAQWEERLAAYVKTSFDAVMLAAIGQNAIQYVSRLTTRCAAVLRRPGRDRRRADGRRARRLQHDRRPGAQPILRLSQLWQDFQQVQISVERLGDILNARTESATASASLPPRRSGAVDVRQRQLPLPARTAGRAEAASLADPARRGHRHRRPLRVGQVDADQAGPALLSSRARPGPPRRHRYRPGRSGLARAPDRRRAAGEHAVQPHRSTRISRSPIRPCRARRDRASPGSPAPTSSSPSCRSATTP